MPTASTDAGFEDHQNHDSAANPNDFASSPPPALQLQPDSNGGNSVALLLEQIEEADSITDASQRDTRLLELLRICREELEVAEKENDLATEQLNVAKELFEFATNFLMAPSRTAALNMRLAKKRFSSDLEIGTKRKKSRAGDDYDYGSDLSGEQDNATTDLEGFMARIPENTVYMPSHYKKGGHGMTEELVTQHRDDFYKRMIGLCYDEIDSYEPSVKNMHIKSISQLKESVHIVRHWLTGADGLEATEFRAKHKSWYSKLKSVDGTGIHLRNVDSIGGDTGGTVLCRHSKDGDRSIVYLDVGRVYDAILEIHAVANDHLSRETTKVKCDELYANITDSQVRTFIDTCPVCCSRKIGI
ncbi:hypothetical protein ACHAXS_012253 [Conticribra weissflogii]